MKRSCSHTIFYRLPISGKSEMIEELEQLFSSWCEWSLLIYHKKLFFNFMCSHYRKIWNNQFPFLFLYWRKRNEHGMMICTLNCAIRSILVTIKIRTYPCCENCQGCDLIAAKYYTINKNVLLLFIFLQNTVGIPVIIWYYTLGLIAKFTAYKVVS